MNKYQIYCTLEQTKKALELGAPIEEFCGLFPTAFVDGTIYDIPTAEQMIGWLEDQDLITEVKIYQHDIFLEPTKWNYAVYRKGMGYLGEMRFETRKDATYAAIDEALNFLLNSK